MNNTTYMRNDLQSRLRSRDGEGAQAEPQTSVRRARVVTRNPRTGSGLTELALPALVNEAPGRPMEGPVYREAEDTQSQGRGSRRNRHPIRSEGYEPEPEPDYLITADQSESDRETEEDTYSNEDHSRNEIETDTEAPDILWSNELLIDPEYEADVNLEEEESTTNDSDEDSIFGYPDEQTENELTIRPTQRNETKRMEKGPKQGIKIGSLNIRGRNATTGDLKKKNKFDLVKRWMKKEEVSVLALIDTHWDDDMVNELKRKYKHHEIHANNESTNRGGVAFIIDKERNNPKDVKVTNLIPGRSSVISIQYDTQRIDLATVYVPNEKRDKINTLKTLRQKIRRLDNRNNMILTGDFNLVEREIDRNPPHQDDHEIVRELTKIKLDNKLLDGWRETHPDELDFTWKGKHSDDFSMARIDRIYVTESQFTYTNEWRIIKTENVLTDHDGVTVKILDPNPPFIGRGEWRLNTNILSHPHLHDRATIAINKLETEIDKYEKKEKRARGNKRTILYTREYSNPQKAWHEYKQTIETIAKETEKIKNKERKKERNVNETKIKRAKKLLKESIDEEAQKSLRIELANAEDELKEMLGRDRRKAEDTSAAKWFKEGEKGTKLWYSLNKERPKRQVFLSLFDSEKKETKSTEEMMDIAREHHKNLQKGQEMTKQREHTIETMLQKITKKLDLNQQKSMDKGITYGEVRNTIKTAKNGKTPGCDGIPSEFWKQEIEWYKEAQKIDEKRPDIVNLMKKVFRDISKYGILIESFTEARMSLLYKKKDKRNIENYRPVTLLNTDYKIYTKIMTQRLNEIAPSIINADQAGFMPKRSIYDQTKLTEMTIKLCEARGDNGVIFALDQEKAYDRIDHEYLWRTLKAFNFSDQTIERIKNLYKSAKTAIRINGCITEPFSIQRGVRQGDPLSCLLYNIAIEPLFELIRTSGLKGIQISPHTENALISAYADDTTIYLHNTDDPKLLDECIEKFCEASTAKFNEEKTEVIPLGQKEYRDRMTETREFNGKPIPREVSIAKDGVAVRILGSYQGNHINANNKWEEIIEKQARVMKLWANAYPSTLARARIAKALVISRAIYLMTVNGISKGHLDEMEKNIRTFIWLGKKGRISWERAILNRNEGGIGAPSAKSLYEAIKVKWIKRWLTPDESRPKWAWAVNEMISRNISETPNVPTKVITEWIEQKWRIKIKSKELPLSLREMITTARKYNVKISILKPTKELIGDMPAFFHPGAKSNRLNNTGQAKCLQKNHGITRISDLLFLLGQDEDTNEDICKYGVERCKQYALKLLNNLSDLWNPLTDASDTNKLYHTPHRLKINREADVKTQSICINPDPMDRDLPLANVRIFGNRKGYKSMAKAPHTPENPLRIGTPRRELNEAELVIVYTDGSAIRNGWENGNTGLGTWYEDGSEQNKALRIEGETQTNQRAELAAILVALRDNQERNLRIYSDSLSSITTITKNLNKYEDLGWNNIRNQDILTEILHEIRTRSGKYEIQWVKAHEDNIGNNNADTLANEGRISEEVFHLQGHNSETSRALHDGARLQALEMKDIYSMIIKERASKIDKILHPEHIENAKDRVNAETELRPTTETVITGIWRLHVPNRIKDHFWNLLVGKIKIGTYWSKIPMFENREFCTFCNEKEGMNISETEHHLWIECEHNGQKQAWEATRTIWNRTTKRQWPQISLDLLRGLGAFTFSDQEGKPDHTKDTERMRILAAITVWAIWKTRNRKSILNEHTSQKEATRELKDSIKDLIKKSWNATRLEKANRRAKKEAYLRNLWVDGTIVHLRTKEDPSFDF